VFNLEPSGLRLLEIAPGVDVADLLGRIPFPVAVPEPPALMPDDIFEATIRPFHLPDRPTGKIQELSKGR